MAAAVMAYGGLRPAEAFRLPWEDVRDGQLWVRAGKTGRGRWVRLLPPLRQDFAEWRLASGRPTSGPVFPRPGGRPWTKTAMDNWRTRRYVPAARAAGVTGDLRPYRLRGSFASLLLWSGKSPTYVAARLGHGPAMLDRHYSGVLAELEDAGPGDHRDPAEAIREARAAVHGDGAVPRVFPTSAGGVS